MRLAVTILAILVLVGCSGDTAPPTALSPSPTPSPTPTPGSSASLWVIVIPAGGSGACIVGAKVEVVAGQAVGQSGTMPDVCDVWWVNGAFFTGLTPGVAMTVRASAPGYVAQERAVMPSPNPGTLVATIIKLPRTTNP
jgi:hypothetical protein